jgi:hypothetical protein
LRSATAWKDGGSKSRTKHTPLKRWRAAEKGKGSTESISIALLRKGWRLGGILIIVFGKALIISDENVIKRVLSKFTTSNY